MVTVSDLAERWGISRKRVWALIAEGRIDPPPELRQIDGLGLVYAWPHPPKRPAGKRRGRPQKKTDD